MNVSFLSYQGVGRVLTQHILLNLVHQPNY